MEGLILRYLPLYTPVLLMTLCFFALILAVIFSWSSESAVFMSCNLFASFACSSDLNILLFTSGNRILSFLLLYFSNSLIIHKENTKEVNV